MRIWDVTVRRLVHDLGGHADAVFGVAWSPDGKRLATASYDFSVRLWDPSMGAEVYANKRRPVQAYGVEFSRDGRRLYVANVDGTAEVCLAAP